MTGQSNETPDDLSPLYQRNPSPLAACVNLARRNRVAGEMLHQLAYRFRQGDALMERGGKVWVAQAVRCWEDEIAASKKQVADAITHLAKLGLVEVAKLRLRADSPLKITHLRLTAAASDALSAGPIHAKRGDGSPPTRGPESTPPQGLKEAIRSGRRGQAKEHYQDRKSGKIQGEWAPTFLRILTEEGQEEGKQGFAAAVLDASKAVSAQLPARNIVELVELIAARTQCQVVPARGKSAVHYTDMIGAFLDRAWFHWQQGDHRPLPPQLVLEHAAKGWSTLRAEYKPAGDKGWPWDFVPGFAVFKAPLIYDVVRQQLYPPERRKFETEAHRKSWREQ